MCGGNTPDAADRLPEAPVAPTQTREESSAERDRKRRRGRGQAGTILTGSGGVTSTGATQQPTILGA